MIDPYRETIIKPGDKASRLAKEVCFTSHKNNSAVIVVPHQPGNFRGPVGYLWQTHLLASMAECKTDKNGVKSWVLLEGLENDGAGGKPQFFTLVGTPEVFFGLGWEIITMTADDFARSGRFPAIIANEVQTKYLNDKNYHLFEAMMQGYGAALRESSLVNITGEVAVMKHSITAFCDADSDDQLILTWGATCIGLAHHDLLIDGTKILPGMPVVGFWEPGYRCNGGTFFTDLILKKWGPKPQKILREKAAVEFARKLTVPSLSYAKTICQLLGWYSIVGSSLIEGKLANIAGIAHITGGGVWEKFGEILPPGVGAKLDVMPRPADVLLEAQELSWRYRELRLRDYRAYGTFHGGCGMLIVADTMDDARTIMNVAEGNGIGAQVVGVTTKNSRNIIKIHSRFKEGKVLRSDEPE